MSSSQTNRTYVLHRLPLIRSIHHLIAGAQYGPSGWQVLNDEIDSRAGAGGYLSAVRTVSGNDTLVRHQIATRATLDRAARLTNRTRADVLLKLLAVQRNGWVNETAWPSESASTYSPIAAVPPTKASTPSPACAHLCRDPQESISDSSSEPTSTPSDLGQMSCMSA